MDFGSPITQMVLFLWGCVSDNKLGTFTSQIWNLINGQIQNHQLQISKLWEPLDCHKFLVPVIFFAKSVGFKQKKNKLKLSFFFGLLDFPLWGPVDRGGVLFGQPKSPGGYNLGGISLGGYSQKFSCTNKVLKMCKMQKLRKTVPSGRVCLNLKRLPHMLPPKNTPFRPATSAAQIICPRVYYLGGVIRRAGGHYGGYTTKFFWT